VWRSGEQRCFFGSAANSWHTAFHIFIPQSFPSNCEQKKKLAISSRELITTFLDFIINRLKAKSNENDNFQFLISFWIIYIGILSFIVDSAFCGLINFLFLFSKLNILLNQKNTASCKIK